MSERRQRNVYSMSEMRKEVNGSADLTDWTAMVENLRNPQSETEIAIVGKYIQLHDAYLSVVEALKHGGIASRVMICCFE